MEVPEQRTGILVLRVWLEGDRPDNFRARVFRTVGSDQAPSLALTTPEDVHSAVRAWLDELLEPGG